MTHSTFIPVTDVPGSQMEYFSGWQYELPMTFSPLSIFDLEIIWKLQRRKLTMWLLWLSVGINLKCMESKTKITLGNLSDQGFIKCKAEEAKPNLASQ